MNQLLATALTWAIAGIGTLVILKIVDLVIGLRVEEQDEILGLDYTQHGEEAYTYISEPALLFAESQQKRDSAAVATPIQPTFSEAGD